MLAPSLSLALRTCRSPLVMGKPTLSWNDRYVNFSSTRNFISKTRASNSCFVESFSRLRAQNRGRAADYADDGLMREKCLEALSFAGSAETASRTACMSCSCSLEYLAHPAASVPSRTRAASRVRPLAAYVRVSAYTRTSLASCRRRKQPARRSKRAARLRTGTRHN